MAAQHGPSSNSSAPTSPTPGCSRSILDQLRPPTASEIMPKRKVRVNKPPHTGARQKNPKSAADPKNVSVWDRAAEFKDEMIVVSSGKLFCSACREELSIKLSIVKYHVNSAKHTDSKKEAGW